MVPMADNFNHIDQDYTYEVINIQKHMEANNDHDYFSKLKYTYDYTPIFNCHGISEPDKIIKGQFDHNKLLQNQKLHSPQVIKKMLNEADSQLWNLPQKMDTYEEEGGENESSDSADEDKKPQM